MQRKPEIKLLLTCARPKLKPEAAEQVHHLLSLSLDWDFLLEKARGHGIAPLMWHHISRLNLANILPDHICAKLSNNFLANSARNMVLSRETVNIVSALKGAGIDAMPHKGPVLAALAYGDLSLRGYCDLDILIRRPDFRRARRVLEDLGYSASKPVPGDLRGFGLESTDQAGFCHSESGILVELQWALLPEWRAKRLDFDHCLVRSVTVEIDGHQIRTLGPEDMAFALAVHGSRHLWSRIEWLASFGAFIEVHAADIDWETVQHRAASEGQLPVLLLGFWMVKELLATRIPVAFRPNRRVAEVGQVICGHLWEGSEEEMLDPVRHFSLLSSLLSRRTRLKQWGYVIIQPTPADWECVRLPSWLHFLYYPLRPVRLVWRHLHRTLGRRGSKSV